MGVAREMGSSRDRLSLVAADTNGNCNSNSSSCSSCSSSSCSLSGGNK